MRASVLRLLLCALLAVAVAAWTKEDHEIFRLNDEIQQIEGTNVTFYDYLGVNRSVKHADIIKAYRRKSKSMHPDKVKRSFIAQYRSKQLHGDGRQGSNRKRNGGVYVAKNPSKKEVDKAVRLATQRYARLALVRDILTGPGRARYDHFLRNGFPRWKGTGYYYSRFRPGLGSVLVGLYIAFAGLGHYAALVLSYKQQRQFVEKCIKHARRTAWGNDMGIGALANIGTGAVASSSPTEASGVDAGSADGSGVSPMNRRQKRMMEKESRKEAKRSAGGASSKTAESSPSNIPEIPTNVPGTYGERRRVELPNGIPVIVDSSGAVYIEEADEEGNSWEELLDADALVKPRFRDTAMFTLPGWLLRRILRRTAASIDESAEQPVEDDGEIIEEIEEQPAPVQSSAIERKGNRRR
ncbi:hypothetical protein KEM54_002164 [Ascosphaera aggregata]|nr:hypothetical protein KEM54_002164 [Ascosphaera aggregata]